MRVALVAAVWLLLFVIASAVDAIERQRVFPPDAPVEQVLAAVAALKVPTDEFCDTVLRRSTLCSLPE